MSDKNIFSTQKRCKVFREVNIENLASINALFEDIGIDIIERNCFDNV